MDLSIILERKWPKQEWKLDGNEYAGLVWLSDSAKPSEKEIVDLWPEVQAELKAEADAIIAKKEAAQAKLAALGLNVDDLKALGLA